MRYALRGITIICIGVVGSQGTVHADTLSPSKRAAYNAWYQHCKSQNFEPAKCKPAPLTMKEVDTLLAEMDREDTNEARKDSLTLTNRDYELEIWKVEQQYRRDVEAVNRDAGLRRSGLLP